jgi:hypothetical protein
LFLQRCNKRHARAAGNDRRIEKKKIEVLEKKAN